MSETQAIQSICVAGGGVVGLSAALAFARALPQVSVVVLETAPDPAAFADRMPGTLPAVHRFHATVGLDELELVRGGAATHLLGYRFDTWPCGADAWFQVFGEHGLPVGGAPFAAVWQRTQAQGQALPFHRYAAAAALAEAGKFAHPSPDPNSPFGTFLYALRLDPPLYRERLKRAAGRISFVQGGIADVARREDGGVAKLVLSDGGRIEADLFIDATGPSAMLLSRIDARFEAWGEYLPCNAFHCFEEAAAELTPVDRIRATAEGWELRSMLPDRTLVCQAHTVEGQPHLPDVTAVRPGRRPDPWVHNVLAVGDAAVSVDPLFGTNLHLAQNAILRALELLPNRDCHPLELREYNRRTAQETERVRDFLALHYLRLSGPGHLSAPAAMRMPPPSLARTLAQFERRGRLPFFEEESFDKNSWIGALLGLGIIPQHADPVAAAIDLERAVPAMESFGANLRAVAATAPPYATFLARMKHAAR